MLNKLLFLSLISLFILPTMILAQSKQNISLLLYNGKVFSADEKGTIYEAVAVDGERIVAVGNSKDLQSKYNAKQSVDLKGKLVTPGFNDAHIHFGGVGEAQLRVNLNGSKTIEEAKRRIAKTIKELPKGAWVQGRGWDHTLWGNRLPTMADLDDIAPNNPVYVKRVDGHISWSNSLAFKLANITKNSKAPTGGEIVFDKNGKPTGVLKETAQNLVSRVVPNPTRKEALKGLELAIEEAKKFGLTSVQSGGDFGRIPLYSQLLNQNKLTVRVAVWQVFGTPLETLKKQRREFQALKLNTSRLKLGILKGYMDGTLGSRTASMLAPFADDPNNKGIPRMPEDKMIKMIVERDKADFQMGLHAIGDRANRIALDGFEKAISENGFKLGGGFGVISIMELMEFRAGKRQFGTTEDPPEVNSQTTTRHRIEHAQVIAPSDFKRFAKLGVIASMQPTHAITDKRWAPNRLGEYRTLGAYAWHTFKSHGVRVPFGTDSPVEPLNPYLTLYAAVSRQSIEGDPIGGWMPQEKLSMEEAIRSYTIESAYAEFAEKEKGTIEVGKFADLVVHSKDLLTIPHKKILETRPTHTIFNGKIVYER